MAGGRAGMPKGKVLYSILISVILFMATQLLIVTRDVSQNEDARMTLTEQLVMKDAELSTMRRELIDRDRDIHRMTRRIGELERRTLSAGQLRQRTTAATVVGYWN